MNKMKTGLRRVFVVVCVVALGFAAGNLYAPKVFSAIQGCPNLEDLGATRGELITNPQARTITAHYRDGRQVVLPMDIDTTKCQNTHTRQMIKQAQDDYALYQKNLCSELRSVANGLAPIPEKGGHKMDLEAVKSFVRNSCSGK